MREYTESYINKFMHYHALFRNWGLGCAIGSIPFTFVNILNSAIWKSALVALIAETGMIGLLISTIILVIIYAVYDIKKVDVDGYVRRQEWDREYRNLEEMHQRIRERQQRELFGGHYTEPYRAPEPKHDHFDEDLFKL